MVELKGKPVCEKIFSQIENDLKSWPSKKFKNPHLTVILVGDDPASQVYVGHKTKACAQLQFSSEVIRLPAQVSEAEILNLIKQLNQNTMVDGILVQLPLPKNLNERKILESISPIKDVDCLTQSNIGSLVVGSAIVKPCTPSGIIEICKYYDIPLQGKKVAVIGRSLIVGTPLVHLLNQENATVTLFHSKSENLMAEIKQFDIVCVAIGKAEFFKVEDFKKGAVVIDVGIHRLENQKLVGDVKAATTDEEKSHLKAKTPVPGGVGITTIAMLMQNTYKSALNQR